MNQPIEPTTFETDLPVTIFVRQPVGQSDWIEFEQGPGRLTIPADREVSLRVKNIDDDDLYRLIRAITAFQNLTMLNLSENRKVTDLGVSRLAVMTSLTRLNLSSCSITNQGLSYLAPLKKLEYLDISYCNRITDEGLRSLKSLSRLTFLDIQGCVKTSHAGWKKIERHGLTIHR